MPRGYRPKKKKSIATQISIGKYYLGLKKKALKEAERMGLSKSSIGKTPMDWYYFTRGAMSHRRK